MSINRYFELKKEFYNNVLAYLEEDESSIYDFEKIIESIKNQDIQTEKEELEHFIQLLLNLSNHHHRDLSFFTKIEQIFDYIKNDIKREMTNSEIFNIFQNNKRLILILYEKEIITFDENYLRKKRTK